MTEINPAGAHQIYSTYLCGATAGGSGNFDEVFGIAVDTAGKVYVTGNAFSTDFPTVNALTTPTNNVAGSVFISKLDPSASGTASLLYSTFFGGLSGSLETQLR